MKIYIVQSNPFEVVVGISDEEMPDAAVNKFLKARYKDIPSTTTQCTGTDDSGTWKNEHVEGNYIKRELIV